MYLGYKLSFDYKYKINNKYNINKYKYKIKISIKIQDPTIYMELYYTKNSNNL